MPDPISISDPADPRLDDYRRLSVPAERRRMEAPDSGRGLPGFFVAEGLTVVGRLLASGRRVRSVVADPPRYERLADALGGREAPVYVVPNDVLCAAAGFDVHRGVLAAADRWSLPDPSDLLHGARRVAVLEGINDHENLGALFRNAAGLGIDAVLLCPRCCDPLYRRSVRVSMGHVMTIPWARLDPWPHALAVLAAAGFTLVALTPQGRAIDTVPGVAEGPVAVLLGAEGPGLSPAALAAADHRLAIPMHAGVDSLNVASAAAVAFWELRTPLQ
ncbi:MAG: TrmH family RNA methyltransferase [Gemmatimonadales bacterium]